MTTPMHLLAIADLVDLFGPTYSVQHPLVAVVDFSQVNPHVDGGTRISANFYSVMFKNYSKTNVRYGRKSVDFRDGSLICLAPNQVIEMALDEEASAPMGGWGLFFHPDLVRATSLGHNMNLYSFFSYQTAEALHLSAKERQTIEECVTKLQTELQENTDLYSQSILVSTIELLLNYCLRYYGRQFITRQRVNSVLVAQVEAVLTAYFVQPIQQSGLPTVKYLAEQVHLSPSYLSDLLKKETGRNAQDHIHFFVIEEAKNNLLSTHQSVAEIAYGLGFEYPQYFNKLFKQKTGYTPLEYRSLN